MNTVLLDTDYVIDFLRGKSDVLAGISSLFLSNIAYLSILSVYELYAGMLPHEEQATEAFIQACHIEPVTMVVAKQAGLFRFHYQKKGVSLSVVDSIIAETARSKNHLLATRNKKHYPENTFWTA